MKKCNTESEKNTRELGGRLDYVGLLTNSLSKCL